MDDANGDLTPQERSLVSKLSRETAPPAALKDRVAAELLQRGLIRPTRRPILGKVRWLWQAAAIVIAFGVGLAIPRGPSVTYTRGGLEDEAPAERVQRTGTLYVEALTALATDAAASPESAREAARNTLDGAAEATARLGTAESLPVPDVPAAPQADRAADYIEIWL